MSSALINRMIHVQLTAHPRNWLEWAQENGVHPWVVEYITQRPDHLFSEPPKTEEPFSTPRSWHMLSDALWEYRAGDAEVSAETLRMLAYFCLTPSHAGMFLAFTKNIRNKNLLEDIIAKEAHWPADPKDRDLLYFLAQSFRAKLLYELPKTKQKITSDRLQFVYRAKSMLKELSAVNFEIAQMTVASGEGEALPEWFMVEVVRDLPRLVQQK